MTSEQETKNSSLSSRALETINNYVKSKTDGVDLSKYDEVTVQMAITQICGLSGIHRATWYDNGVAYQIQEKRASIDYREGDGIFIDAKKFLEED